MKLELFDNNYIIDVKKISDFIIQNIIYFFYIIQIFVSNLHKLGYNSNR